MPEYSISQLGKFEECALQYKFIYVDGIKRYEKEGAALSAGPSARLGWSCPGGSWRRMGF
jgi:hypothetical protein